MIAEVTQPLQALIDIEKSLLTPNPASSPNAGTGIETRSRREGEVPGSAGGSREIGSVLPTGQAGERPATMDAVEPVRKVAQQEAADGRRMQIIARQYAPTARAQERPATG